MQPLEVKELSKYIFNVLKRDPILSDVYVTGEVSNFKRSGGHVYFSLKDDRAMIRCVVFRNMPLSRELFLENGQKINVRGKITTFDRGSVYQILVKKVEDAGLGVIFQSFLELKEKLEREGLFDPRYKKEIPRYPEKIGVLTADTGAAKHDMIDTIRRRYPIAEIYFCASKVQGQDAPAQLVRGLRRLDRAGLDTILFGRGGGSFEDLNAFNDETLLRTVFAMKTPVISAVGHETDTMLSDYVADLRAATPTAAAELATPDLNKMIEGLDGLMAEADHRMKSRMTRERDDLEQLEKRLSFYRPEERLREMGKSLEELARRGKRYYRRNLVGKINERARLFMRLQRMSPLVRLEAEAGELKRLREKADRLIDGVLEKENNRVDVLKKSLDLLNPMHLMEKGYTKVYKDGDSVKSTASVETGDDLCFVLKDGKVYSRVTGKEE